MRRQECSQRIPSLIAQTFTWQLYVYMDSLSKKLEFKFPIQLFLIRPGTPLGGKEPKQHAGLRNGVGVDGI